MVEHTDPITAILWIALAVQGEGAGLFAGLDCAAAIAETVINQAHDLGWSIERTVVENFHGWINVPDMQPAQWAIDVSRETYERFVAGSLEHDKYFVLSDHDLRDHWLDGSTRVLSFHQSGDHLYFFSSWPERLPDRPQLTQ